MLDYREYLIQLFQNFMIKIGMSEENFHIFAINWY